MSSIILSVFSCCELHADRETEAVGGQVNGGGRLACIEKKGSGRLPGTWALTLTRPKTGGWALTREWALTRDTTVDRVVIGEF